MAKFDGGEEETVDTVTQDSGSESDDERPSKKVTSLNTEKS